MKGFIASILIIFVLTGCKKKDPVETTELSVFSFIGTINGSQVSYFSGQNEYYMHTSFSTDGNNVREFIGELKVKNCNPCANSIKVRIKDYRSLAGLATKIDSSLTTDYYAYSLPAGNSSAYTVTFVPQFIGGTIQSYLWTFHDGSTSTSAMPVITYNKNGKYNVCVSITSTASCNSSLCNLVKIGQTGDGVESGFAVSTPTGNVLSFTAQPVLGTPPYTYSWNFGDGGNSTVANPTHTYSTNGVYLVSLTVTDSKNRTATYNNNVNTQSPGTCLTRFGSVKAAVSNTLNLSNVVVEWTDANGVTYSSENNSQPAISGFKIVSVEEYNLNEWSQRTKKIKALFNCTLYSGSTSVTLTDAEFVFAIAYP